MTKTITKTHFVQAIALLLLALGLLLTPFAALAQSPASTAQVDNLLESQPTARVIIALRPGTTAQALADNRLAAQSVGEAPADIQPVHQFENLPGLVADVTAAGLAALRQNPDVVAVALDMPVYAADAVVSENAAFIGADAVWRDFGLTGAGVTVAVLDTGIDLNHPDFANAVVAQQCFSQNNNCPPDMGQVNGAAQSGSAQDDHGHGTHIAGILAGRGQIALPGIAPEAGLVVVKVLGGNGSGYSSDVLAGIDWVVTHQAQFNIKLMNLSLGGGSYSGECDQSDATTMLYAAALQVAQQSGLTIFAASGNGSNAQQMMAPACVAGVVSVGNVYHTALTQLSWPGCTDQNIMADQVPCSSNSSPTLDLLAPGVLISAAQLGGGQISRSGTSMATPHATAAAALLLQADSTLTAAEITAILRETGTPVVDSRNQRPTPRLNALAAVARVLGVETLAISGQVHLQGRNNHSDIDILLDEAACGIDTNGTAAAVTAADGTFAVHLTDAAGVGCLQAIKAGYLTAQADLPAESAGSISLANITLPGGDVTLDNRIDVLDLAFIATYYNTATPTADINADGLANILDLVIVAGNYGRQGPIPWTETVAGN